MPIKKIDKVLIEALSIDASIGVFDWEKEIKQRLVFDIVLETDFTQAALSDHIDDAIDYVAVCEVVKSLVVAKHYQLLEHLADCIAASIMERFSPRSLSLTIRKPGAVPEAENVGVSLSWSAS